MLLGQGNRVEIANPRDYVTPALFFYFKRSWHTRLSNREKVASWGVATSHQDSKDKHAV